MSDGRSWYPGSDDPRYDPYAQPQPPQGPPQQRRGQYPPQQPQQQPQYPQGYRQPSQGQPQPARGPVRGPGPSRYDAPADPYAPPRRPQPPQQRPRYDAPSGPYAPPPRRPQQPDVWQAPDPDAEPYDGVPNPRRRRSGAGTGPGRQTDGPTGPGHVNADVDLDELDPDGRAQRAWEKEKARLNRPPSRARQATKWGAIGMSMVLLAAVGFAGYVYETTVGSIKSTPLMPNGMTQAALPPDKYGNTPLNILLIGSDTRSSAADCHLGGDCGGGANGDSEMILHVSAERTNATIISIPRDTVAYLPNCTEDKSGNTSLTGTFSTYQINSALQNGPECQVAAVHYLSNVTITGYIMFDFSGIVNMSNALGGVPVCVTHAVNDKDSGLKLPAGTSVIQGQQALEFLRTRHSFFDGSDLGREMATHYFMSQLIQTLRKNMNFSSLSTLLSIGQAAAKSTTISSNFAGLTNLESLVESLNKVPSKNITMMTMPWMYDPHNGSRVIPESSAKTIFADIQNDVSFTNTAAKPAAGSSSAAPQTSASSAPPVTSVDKSQVPVHVYNADGVAGRASAITQALTSAGFTQAQPNGNRATVTSSLVYYASSSEQAGAQAVAAALGIPASQVQQNSSFPGVSVFVGTDFESGTKLTPLITTSAAAAAQPNTSGAPSAPAESRESFATDSSTECVPWFSGSGSGTLSLVKE
jgi:LCP family protein required for cell wall assembly